MGLTAQAHDRCIRVHTVVAAPPPGPHRRGSDATGLRSSCSPRHGPQRARSRAAPSRLVRASCPVRRTRTGRGCRGVREARGALGGRPPRRLQSVGWGADSRLWGPISGPYWCGSAGSRTAATRGNRLPVPGPGWPGTCAASTARCARRRGRRGRCGSSGGTCPARAGSRRSAPTPSALLVARAGAAWHQHQAHAVR